MAIPYQENLPLAGSGGPKIPKAERIGQAEPGEQIPFTIFAAATSRHSPAAHLQIPSAS
jgi:hypothetical protein